MIPFLRNVIEISAPSFFLWFTVAFVDILCNEDFSTTVFTSSNTYELAYGLYSLMWIFLEVFVLEEQ